MAEISKINVDGIDYNIRDKVLDEKLTELESKYIIRQGYVPSKGVNNFFSALAGGDYLVLIRKVSPGEKLLIYTDALYLGFDSLAAFTNADNPYGGAQKLSDLSLKIGYNEVIVPDGATYIGVTLKFADALGLPQNKIVAAYSDYGMLEKIREVEVGLTAKLPIEKFQSFEDELRIIGNEIPYSSVVDCLLDPANGKEIPYEGATATEYIPISEGYYYIDASSFYSNGLYCIYNSDKVFLKGVKANSGATPTELAAELIYAPAGAAYIRIAQLGDSMRASIYNCAKGFKKWQGKKWVCVGDSLTERNIRAKRNYHDYVAAKTGIEVVNMGQSGSGYKKKEDSNNAFYQRILNVPTDADVITIFGSGNDGEYWENAMGTATDKGTETLGGCINTTLDNLFSVYPLAVVGIVSPTPWLYQTPSNPQSGMSLYTDLLREICELRGIPFLDLFHCSGFRPNSEEYRELVFSRDPAGNATHPDETGHKLIAPRFKAFLESLIL